MCIYIASSNVGDNLLSPVLFLNKLNLTEPQWNGTGCIICELLLGPVNISLNHVLKVTISSFATLNVKIVVSSTTSGTSDLIETEDFASSCSLSWSFWIVYRFY